VQSEVSYSLMKYFASIKHFTCLSAPAFCVKPLPRSSRRAFVMSASLKAPRRFAPLKEGVVDTKDVPKLKGIVFDVDGTLW